MKWLTIAARVLLGLVFVGSSIAFFTQPPPEIPPGNMADFFKGMMATGYMFYLVKGVELVCGLLLISGFFVPLALVVLAPVLVNIFMVHAMMTPPDQLILPVIMGGMAVYLSFFSREYSPTIKQLFKVKP